MRPRPLAVTAVAAVLVATAAGPAAARSTAAADTPVGTATSALNLLSLALANHSVQVGGVALTSDTVSGDPVAKVVVTPLKVDGTAYGEQTVTPASSPATVPVVDSSTVVPAALAALASVKSPAFDASASNTDGASSKAGTASLGSVSVLGLPLALDGAVNVTSAVTDASAVGEKTITVENLALPSIADILAALGLNLPKLPVETLTKLLTDLGLTSTAVTTAQQALATAQAAFQTQLTAAQKAVDDQQALVDAAKADLATKLSALDAAKVDLTAAQAVVTTAQDAFDDAAAARDAAAAAITAVLPVGTTLDQYLVLFPSSTLVTTYNNAVALVTSTGTALANAKTAADAAQVVVNTAQAAVDTAQTLVNDLVAVLNSLIAALNAILANLQPQIDALLAAITALLDGTPLVSIDSITLQTQALVTSATAGGQTAKVVGGELVGLNVLGTDVLQNVLGTSSVDLLDLAGNTLTSVTSAINGLTGTLSSVLSNVPSLPTLSIPAPQIGLFTKTASTSIADGFGVAENSVKALTITIPAITLPAAVALPDASSLPAISGLPTGAVTTAVGDLVSKPITLGLVTLSEQSKFRPTLTSAPGSAPTTPNLAATGLPAGLALVALLFVGGALLMRRRFDEAPDA